MIIVCVSCNHRLKVPDIMAGRQFNCPKCKATQTASRNTSISSDFQDSMGDAIHTRTAPRENSPPSAFLNSIAHDGGQSLGELEDLGNAFQLQNHHPRERVSSGWVSLALSCLAVALSLAALTFVLMKPNPLGNGLGSYDFSTPEAAAKSILQVQANRDILASIELDELNEDGKKKENLKTFKVARVANFQEKRVVFFSMKSNGKEIKDLGWFRKDSESNLWLPNRGYIGFLDVEKVDPKLAKDMRGWRKDDLLDEDKEEQPKKERPKAAPVPAER